MSMSMSFAGRNAAYYGLYANQQADSGALTGRTDVGDGSITGHYAMTCHATM